MRRMSFGVSSLLLSISATGVLCAADSGFEGSWKWTSTGGNGQERTRTLKVTKEGDKLAAKVVSDQGEIEAKDLKVDGNQISFGYTIERNGNSVSVKYSGKRDGDTIQGTSEFGTRSRAWLAKREASAPAPSAKPGAPAAGAGEWVPLIHGTRFAESGWKLRHEAGNDHKDGWTLADGILKNTPPSTDIVTEKTWKDFELHVEFNVPKGSNSGVYLRGSYEVQVEDTAGKPITKTVCGSIYGQKEPSENAALPAGQWQTFDITLVGNKVTVIHNGKKVIDGFEIPGKTGGSLDVKHGDPGPLLLQGDHGSVEYRNIKIRPITSETTRL